MLQRMMGTMVSPQFGNVYVQTQRRWLDVTTQDELMPQKMKETYHNAPHRKAVLVSSDEVEMRIAARNWSKITLKELPVLLTGEEAQEFEGAPAPQQKKLVQAWLDEVYQFQSLQIATTDRFERKTQPPSR